MAAPEEFVQHLRAGGYHPRSNAHSNALNEAVLRDLLTRCPKIRQHFDEGLLVYELNVKVIFQGSEWNVDLVIGSPPAGFSPPGAGQEITRHRPSTIRIAVEAKAVMTEHGKARRNRQRDLDSFHQFVHRVNQNIVAGALTVVNIAERFRSPLRRGDITTHKNVRQLVTDTLALIRHLPVRSETTSGAGLEANGAIVVNHDNIDNPAARLVTAAPAPQVGDPLHYDAFIQHICDQYTRRW